MQGQEVLVIPRLFPAKLWYLVNNPAINAIVWDSQGETVIIDKELTEKHVLPFSNITLNTCHTFKPIKFSTFFRHMYAYGFKQVDYLPTVSPNVYQFFHPNFKRSNPELLSLLRRCPPKLKRKRPPALAALPKDRNMKKDVCVQCDDEDIWHEDESIMTSHFESTLQPQFHRSNNGAGPSTFFNRPQVPQPNYVTSLVPYSNPRCSPSLKTGMSNVVYNHGPFVPAFFWYQQNLMVPGFCGFYQMDFPVNAARLPVSSFAQRMPCPSAGLQKSCVVTELNDPSPALQHLPIMITDSETSGPGLQISPVAEAAAHIQDMTTKGV